MGRGEIQETLGLGMKELHIVRIEEKVVVDIPNPIFEFFGIIIVENKCEYKHIARHDMSAHALCRARVR